MKRVWTMVFGLVVGLSALPVGADQFHYNNALVGERAMGLGGAYCAVADDASGVVYNPAGLAFALSNDISGSATVPLSAKTTEYLKTIENKSFIEKSQGKFSPFVGSLLKLDHILQGLVFAFGLWTSDAELKDQNDIIVANNIPRFHRTVNLRASTDYVGVSFAKRFGSTISLGIGANYFSTDELLQEYQDALTVAAETPIFQVLNQNIRQRLSVSGVEPVLGLQMVFGKLTLGLMAKVPIIMSQKFENGIERHIAFVDSNLTVIDPTGGTTPTLTRAVVQTEDENPIGAWPAEYRLGTALFATTTLMWSLDVVHRSAADGNVNYYDRNAVTNFSTGVEWYITSSLPLRMGYFTNYDARPDVVQGKKDQRDHIDYHGASVFLGWVQPNSSISFGTVVQTGSGKAQKIGGSERIQEVEGTSYALAYSASHNF
jgi:long-chain fatty acid transport protein